MWRRIRTWRRNHPEIFIKIELALLAFFVFLVGLANYQQRTDYHYADQDFTNFISEKEHFQQLSAKLCPKEKRNNVCDTPCWNGVPYQEPEFLVTPDCTKYSKTEVLIYIYSRPGNRASRDVMRASFHDVYFKKKYSNLTASLVFVVGTTYGIREKLNDVELVIKHEQGHYGDMLQIDIPDNYTNLAFKGLGAFKFIIKCGKSIKHIVKLDDDPTDPIDFRTVFRTIAKIGRYQNETYNRIICLHVFYNVVVHEPKEKKRWEASFQQYFKRRFPPYCYGNSGIFMDRQVAVALYKAARGRRVYHIDDVYITGLLRERACIPFDDWSSVRYVIEQTYRRFMQFLGQTHAYEFISKDMYRNRGSIGI